jgi:hypothetical protein
VFNNSTWGHIYPTRAAYMAIMLLWAYHVFVVYIPNLVNIVRWASPRAHGFNKPEVLSLSNPALI